MTYIDSEIYYWAKTKISLMPMHIHDISNSLWCTIKGITHCLWFCKMCDVCSKSKTYCLIILNTFLQYLNSNLWWFFLNVWSFGQNYETFCLIIWKISDHLKHFSSILKVKFVMIFFKCLIIWPKLWDILSDHLKKLLINTIIVA